MHDLPRKLTARDLAALFEGRTRFVERLATHPDPLRTARDLLRALPEAEVIEALNAHPPIGVRGALSAASAREQGEDDDPKTIEELARLNRVYEERFGFRFVVFVNGRTKTEILEVLRARLKRTREEEIEAAINELVSIAEDRASRR